MTRKWFLSLIGLGAAGQTVKMQEAHPIYTIPNHPASNGKYKPANGECPVCGTIAPAFPLIKPSYPYAEAQGFFVEKTRVVSCAHCRARFDQDAEGSK